VRACVKGATTHVVACWQAEAAASGRGAVEAYYVSNSFAFFAGWAWVVLLRDLAALVGQQAVLRETRRNSFLGLASLDRVELSAFGGQLASLVLFGPVLSWLVYRVRRRCAQRTPGEVEASVAKDVVELLPRHRAVGTPGRGRPPGDEESE